MKIGISTFVNDDSIDTVSLARGIEERGFALGLFGHEKSRQWAVGSKRSGVVEVRLEVS